MFTLKVTYLQESSTVAPALPLPHLAWPFTHTCAHTRTDCTGREGATAPKKLHPVFNTGLGLQGFD